MRPLNVINALLLQPETRLINQIRPNLEYSGLNREDLEEKFKILNTLWHETFQDPSDFSRLIKGKPHHSGGYWYFPEFSHRKLGEGGVTELIQEFEKKYLYSHTRLTQEEIDKYIDQLSQEYKIHLMPQPDYTYPVLKKLFESIKNKAKLQDSLASIKVINDERKVRSEVMPIIVIYTQLGKDTAQLALDMIYDGLQGYDEVGLGVTPRYNRQIDKLIYYAQSDGSLKSSLIRIKTMNPKEYNYDLFEPDYIHFMGDHHLVSPKTGLK